MTKVLANFCWATIFAVALSFGVAGCNWNQPNSESTAQEDQRQRDEKTREEAAKATERLKPALETAGRELNEAAQKAGEDVRAAAEGVKDGWASGPHAQLDLNSASERDLTTLPGITAHDADRIIRGRPYSDKRDLVSKHILNESHYDEIRDRVVAR